MAGGLKVTDPACDLATVAAILSSNFDIIIPNDIAFAAEIGLSGEIRPVSQVEKRISEAQKLGFKKIFVSSFSKVALNPAPHAGETQVVKISTIQELVKAIF